MTRKATLRIRAVKAYLKRKMLSFKPLAHKVKLTRPTIKEVAAQVGDAMPGLAFTNVARDIRKATEVGESYDAELDLLWRGLTLPHVVANYTESYLAHLIKDVVAPDELTRRLATLPRTRPDGRRTWEEF